MSPTTPRRTLSTVRDRVKARRPHSSRVVSRGDVANVIQGFCGEASEWTRKGGGARRDALNAEHAEHAETFFWRNTLRAQRALRFDPSQRAPLPPCPR